MNWRNLTDHQCDICGDDVQILTSAGHDSEGYDGDPVRCSDGHTEQFVVTEDEAYCEWNEEIREQMEGWTRWK